MTPFIKFPIYVIFCILLNMVGINARAEPDERPLTPDYSRLYYLGYDHATSSSPCIGNPVTPECAAVTYAACKEWWDQSICDTINIKLPGPAGSADKRSRVLYKNFLKRTITANDIPDKYKENWRVGDTLVFTAVQACSRYTHCYSNLEDRSDPKGQCPPIDCSPVTTKPTANGKYHPNMYILREQSPQKWIVADVIQSWDFESMKDHTLDKLLHEGLEQTPW